MGKLQTERREQECEVFRMHHINHAALSAFEMHNCAMLVWRFICLVSFFLIEYSRT